MNADEIKRTRDNEERLGRILNRMAIVSDADLLDYATKMVTGRQPAPAMRERYFGEDARHYDEYNAGRLRLLWAMRQAATRLDVEIQYKESLW